MSDTQIKVKVLCNDEDVKKAVYYIINYVKKSWNIFPVAIIIIIGNIIYGINNGFNNYFLILLTVCLLLTVLLYTILYKRPVSSYLDYYRKRKENTYIFSDEGIQLVNQSDTKIFEWNKFMGFYETPQTFVLSDFKMIYYIFPKRCFNNFSEVEQIEKLFSSKIKKLNKM
ncbi:YcxB-like protein [Ruminiclostridium sufflavum DSM 19573]|uniref:YcxB-like protein n=1 Tax=Ruminiclostridium sufflavum DSM 19573 TaxID=1121337 RepID=A0A318XM51_9FIRM|nr:YcxB family protein [Ruminiclostridium sufflavum]PYG87563.1 YcxB-like protein [Ruminiclostridium sufflavum DSM 19573]